MLVYLMGALLAVCAGCGAEPEPATAPRGTTALARSSGTSPASAVAPDCSLARRCGVAIEAGRCLDDPALFEVVAADGVPIDVRLSRAGSVSALSTGTWYTVVGTSCDDAIVLSFDADVARGEP